MRDTRKIEADVNNPRLRRMFPRGNSMEKQMEICERFAGKHIVKRNGSVKPFDVTKIVSAVTRAGKATGEFGEAKALDLVCAYVLPRLDEKSTLCIELVQDAVEHALFEAGCFKTLRAYIVYRETRTKARDAKQSWVNVEAPSTNTSTRSTGASTRTPTRAIRSAASS